MSLALAGTLDTNILLRFLLADVPEQHTKAKRKIESNQLWYISNLSIAEIVFVLEGLGVPRDLVAKNLYLLSSYTNLYMNRQVIIPALDLYLSRPSLSFIDAALAYEAIAETATPLLTFDRKLANQAESAKLL